MPTNRGKSILSHPFKRRKKKRKLGSPFSFFFLYIKTLQKVFLPTVSDFSPFILSKPFHLAFISRTPLKLLLSRSPVISM